MRNLLFLLRFYHSNRDEICFTNLALNSGHRISVYARTTSILLIAIKKIVTHSSHKRKTMDNDFVIYCNLFISVRTTLPVVPIKVYTGLFTPSSPRIRKGVLTSGSYRRATKLCSRRPSHKRSTISPICLAGTRTNLSPFMDYYPYATYLLPHFSDFHPASRPSSLNPSAY